MKAQFKSGKRHRSQNMDRNIETVGRNRSIFAINFCSNVYRRSLEDRLIGSAEYIRKYEDSHSPMIPSAAHPPEMLSPAPPPPPLPPPSVASDRTASRWLRRTTRNSSQKIRRAKFRSPSHEEEQRRGANSRILPGRRFSLSLEKRLFTNDTRRGRRRTGHSLANHEILPVREMGEDISGA